MIRARSIAARIWPRHVSGRPCTQTCLNAAEREFLAASINHEQHEQQEREEQQKRELDAAQKLAETERARAEEQTHSADRLRTRNRVITTVGSIALILALVAGLFGVQSIRNAGQAETNFNRAEAQRLALEANRLLLSDGSSEQIALLSLRSMNTHYTPEGDAALAAAARLDYPVQSFTNTSEYWTVAFSPDGKYVLTGNYDDTAKLWDAQSGQELRRFTGHKDIIDVYFSPDGKHMLTLSWDSIRIVGHSLWRGDISDRDGSTHTMGRLFKRWQNNIYDFRR